MFQSAKLKIEWANAHIGRLIKVIRDYLDSDFYTLSNERDARTGHYLISLHHKRLPPADIYLLIGDIVHNLRSSLDHIATEITGNDNIYFPFHEKRESLVNADGNIVCWKTRLIEAAIPTLGRVIIDDIRPYKGGRPFIWPLTKLDAIDKHKFLIPAICLTGVIAHDLYDPEHNNSVGALRLQILSGESFNALASSGQFQIRGKIEPSFSVVFTKETFFEGAPVVETLINISVAVSETLSRIEDFITRAKEA
jgi:hypothetical protein